MKPARSQGRREPALASLGFTLVELSVVIAVFALLAALLLPTLIGAEQKAQGAQCLNNLKQLGDGWAMYYSDNRGALPQNGDEGNQPGTPNSGQYPQWCPGRMDFGAPTGQPTNVLWIEAGQIYPFVGSPGPYRCPADHSTYRNSTQNLLYPMGGPGNPRLRSVSMNSWIQPVLNNDIGADWTDYRVYRKDSDMVVPGAANLWLFLDENPYAINDGFFWEEPAGAGKAGVAPTATSWIDYPASYHNNGGGICFSDGHAQIHNWTDKAVLNLRVQNPSGEPGTPPYTDLNWLLARMTAHK